MPRLRDGKNPIFMEIGEIRVSVKNRVSVKIRVSMKIRVSCEIGFLSR